METKWLENGGEKAGQEYRSLALDYEVSKHNVTWDWVKGHSGHLENEKADQLANRGIEALG